MERDQVELVWERYRGRLLSFIRYKVSREEEAEDLLQDVFVRLHTGLCCLEEWSSLERWIYRVARNRIIDYYRARRSHQPLDGGEESPYGRPEPDDDPAAPIAFSLRETIESMPAPYRDALILTEYEGLSQAEYASREGVSLPAAKSRILRARAKLKELLLACCHFEFDRLGGIVDYEARCAACDRRRAEEGRRRAPPDSR